MATATWNKEKYRESGRDQGRGRAANTPKEIPAVGWKDTLMRVKDEVKHDRLSMISAAMSYYMLLAFVPAMTSLILMYAWISDPNEISQHLARAERILPSEVLETLTTQMTTLSSQASSALGLSAIGTLLFSIWSASKGSSALIDALNIIYDEEDQRGFFKSTFMSLGFTLLGTVLSMLAIGVIIGFPAVTKFLNLAQPLKSLIGIASWVVLLGIFSFFLSFAYRYAPNRNEAQWKWVSWGAIIAAVLWAAVSALFSWYVTEFGNFNKTYGSMGAVVVLMMWFYFSSFVVLLGGEINAELEHQTKKDTTKGAPRPMGQRNAQMADTLGEAPVRKKA